jgi:hypothetical protein
MRLRITGCRDPRMWYANLVGQHVPFLGKWPEGYKSCEQDGHINVVRFEDAELEDRPQAEGEDA